MVSCFLGNSLVRFSDVSEKRYRRYSEHIALPGVKWSENNASAQDIVRCFGMFHAAPASLLLLLLEPGVHRQMTRAVNVLLPVGAAAEDLRAVLVLGLGPALAKAILEKCASLHSRACVSLYISNQEFCSITRELVGSGRSRWLSLGSLSFPSGQHGTAFYTLILGAAPSAARAFVTQLWSRALGTLGVLCTYRAQSRATSPGLGVLLPLLPSRVSAQNSIAGG